MVAQGATYFDTITCWVDKFEEYLALLNTAGRAAAEVAAIAAQVEAALLTTDYTAAVGANQDAIDALYLV